MCADLRQPRRRGCDSGHRPITDRACVDHHPLRCVCVFVLFSLLFEGPKLYYIAVGRADDKSMTQTTAQTATPRASKQYAHVYSHNLTSRVCRASGLGSARDLNASGGSEPNTPKGKGSNGSNGRKGSERSVRTHRTDSKSDIEMETVQ